MPITISSPKFSLIKFDNLDTYVLPAYLRFNSAFQFIVNGDLAFAETLRLGVLNNSGALITTAFPAPVNAVPISHILDLTEPNYDAWASFFLMSVTVNGVITEHNQQVTKSQFKSIMLDNYGYEAISNNRFYDNGTGNIFTVSFQEAANPAPGGGSYEVINHDTVKIWHRGYVAAPGNLIGASVPVGSCFRYCLLDSGNNIVAYTNIFKVYSSNKYLSLITYSNNESAFDFAYPVIYNNIQLVPVYLSRPTLPTKRSGYRYSNGRHKLLSATIEKRYQLRADYMPASFHEAITAALLHDNITIDCANIEDTPIDIISSEDYQVEWDDEIEQKAAQARSMVTVASYGFKNDNCE